MDPQALENFPFRRDGSQTSHLVRNAIGRFAQVAALVLTGMLCGCVSIERSRSLSNPDTPARTIALQVCSNCHGTDGNSTSPNFPKLAGQQPAYFIAQLNGFKSHNRADPAGFEYMWGLSKRLSDQQIEGLAAYFAEQRPLAPAATTRADATAGKAIFENGVPSNNIPPCGSCHGVDGGGSNTFPRLANQHADYLIKQLYVFQRTDERPQGAVMKEVAHALTEEQIVSIAIYLEAMH